MYAFEDLESVHNALNLLAKREPPLVKVLPRQPGTKESRYVHLLSPVEDVSQAEAETSVQARKTERPADGVDRQEQFAAMEAEIGRLRGEVAALKEQFAQFRKQFE
jgi:hypothetical protein